MPARPCSCKPCILFLIYSAAASTCHVIYTLMVFKYAYASCIHFVLLLLLTAEGNGGKTDKYEWAQTLGELSVTVPLPPGTKSRDIVCTISRKKLKAGIKGQPLIIDVSLPAYCIIVVT
jgi:CS domain